MKEQIEKQIQKMKKQLGQIETTLASTKFGEMDNYEHGELNGEAATLRQTIVELKTIVDFA